MSGELSELSLGGRDEAGLLTRLRRRKGLFLAVFVTAAGLIGLIYMVLPSSYLATGAVTVTAYNSQMGDQVSAAAEQKLGDPADMDTQIIVAGSPRLMKEMLRQPEVVQALLRDCEVRRQSSPIQAVRGMFRVMIPPNKPCDQELAGQAALDWLRDNFVIGSAGRSRVIQIAYRSPSPEVATTLVNRLIASYLDQTTLDKQRSRSQAATWIKSEIDRIGGELRQSEIVLEDFRRRNGLVRGQTASIASERLTLVSQQLSAAEAAWSDAGAKLDQLRKGASDARQTLESRTIADLKQQLSQVSGDLAKTASTYGRSHPDLAALRQQRNDLQRRITDETSRIRSSLEREYASSSAQVAALRKQLADIKQDVGAADLAETQIAGMVRDNDIKRELYVDLSKKANDLEAQRRLLTGDVRLVNYAEMPTKVAFPKLPMFVIAGFVFGIVSACAAALLRDRSDASVRASGWLEAASGARVLGHIPHVRRLQDAYAEGAGRQLVRPSALQESIRSLYAKCILLGKSTRPQTILLTSANPGEGKSFLTLAMAQFGAATGQRVLAVEGDLRRPGFRAAFGLADGPGLAEILRAKVDYAEAVRKTNFGFDILPAGTATIASTELLSNGRITAFLDWARARYDLVLIDSPPAQILMDAHVLASRVDGVLFCARWGHSSVDAVADSVDSIRQAGGRVIGLALAMVQPREYRLYEPASLPERPYLMAPG